MFANVIKLFFWLTNPINYILQTSVLGEPTAISIQEPAPSELDDALKKISNVPKLAELWDAWVEPTPNDININRITKYGTHIFINLIIANNKIYMWRRLQRAHRTWEIGHRAFFPPERHPENREATLTPIAAWRVYSEGWGSRIWVCRRQPQNICVAGANEAARLHFACVFGKGMQ